MAFNRIFELIQPDGFQPWCVGFLVRPVPQSDAELMEYCIFMHEANRQT